MGPGAAGVVTRVSVEATGPVGLERDPRVQMCPPQALPHLTSSSINSLPLSREVLGGPRLLLAACPGSTEGRGRPGTARNLLQNLLRGKAQEGRAEHLVGLNQNLSPHLKDCGPVPTWGKREPEE